MEQLYIKIDDFVKTFDQLLSYDNTTKPLNVLMGPHIQAHTRIIVRLKRHEP